MNRFFVLPSAVDTNEKKIEITGEDVKHIAKVLRLNAGDQIEISDGVEREYAGVIEQIEKDRVIVSYQETKPFMTEPPISVILYQGVPKADKMELIVQKTVEMGIVAIVPVLTKRTIVQFHTAKDADKKIERWQKIGMEAAKQSKRGRIPAVHPPMTLHQAMNHSRQNDFNIIAYEEEKNQTLKAVLQLAKSSQSSTIGIWIGPEGGYDQQEIEQVKEQGIHAVTLGPRILRTETAGLGLLAMLMYQLGDLGGY